MSAVTVPRSDCLALPYLTSSEEKAEQLADALEVVFMWDIQVETFEDGGRWGVVVVEGMERITDPLNDERIVSTVVLLSNFDLTERTDSVVCIEEIEKDLPAAQEGLTRRARRRFRVEDKLDCILTALVGVDGKRAMEERDPHRRQMPRMSATTT